MGKFKDDVGPSYIGLHDIVLVYINEKAAFFARVESIVDDKPGWYTVGFSTLTIPMRKFTWTLDDSHLSGEVFTLGGVPHKLEVIPPELPPDYEMVKKKPIKVFRPGNKVIPLFGPRPEYKYEFKHEGVGI